MNRADLLLGLVSGAILMGYGVCALFFLRFWRQTRDRLFLVFALAFGLLGLQRLALVLTEPVEESRTGLYVVRLVAFLLILGAIVDKNRGDHGGSGPTSTAASARAP
jgi:amino acid transporter